MLGDLISAGVKLFSGAQDRKAQEAANERNAALQREFAQNSIRWRVDDAKAAGIHPLYAIGAPTISASSSYVAESGMADALSSASQDIGRAVNATRTQPERDAAFTKSAQALSLQKSGLENELLATQIAKLRTSLNPPMPTLGDAGPVPEKNKFEDRPKLMWGGTPIATDPKTTNMDDFSKRYGDEGLPQWLIPPLIMWEDMKANIGQPSGGKTGFREGSVLDRWLNRQRQGRR